MLVASFVDLRHHDLEPASGRDVELLRGGINGPHISGPNSGPDTLPQNPSSHGCDHGKEDDSGQAEKHNLGSLVTEQDG